MAEEIIATFSVRSLRILDETGTVDDALMPPLADGEIMRMYEVMVFSRVFDERALSLQREGRLGTYPPILGQEAAQVGSAFALEPVDWVFPAFREMGVLLALGYPSDRILQYWRGDERGLKTPDHLNIAPISVSVGTHIPHAVGAALAAKYRRDRTAVVCYFGDGATSKGDFHEGFNMAGVMKAPVVFICQNNQWAISIPRAEQTAAATLAQKACAYGFDGIQVDGNDVFAVYRATKEAVDKARAGGGPTFIECFTYRLGDHTTADDASRYRSIEAVAPWKEKDPLLRLERYLERRGLWTPGVKAECETRAMKEVDEATAAMEAVPSPAAAEMFARTAAALTPRQMRQLEEL